MGLKLWEEWGQGTRGGGSRGSGRRARGTVCIAPEAEHVSPPRGSPGWLALRHCHLESWLLFSHLRLFIIVGASIEIYYTSGTGPYFVGYNHPLLPMKKPRHSKVK